MKKLCSFPILLALILFLLASSPANASLIAESAEIPYQVNNSDRIMIGTVSGVKEHYDHTIFTVTIKEWLYNPLPAETIKVRTEAGKYVWTEDQAEFTLNESVLLMLRDQDPDKRLFIVSVGFPGKHPVSNRDAVIDELKAQGKWLEENKTEGAEPAGQKTVNPDSSPDQEKVPSTGVLWVIASILGVAVCLRKEK